MRIRGSQSAQPVTVWANSVQWLAFRGAQQIINNAPLASSVSVSTTMDTATTVVLSGTDEDGDALTYTLDTSGLSGTLSGTAPTLSYTPAAGFTGTDTFSYTVSDGALSSPSSVVTISVAPTGLISNPATAITLDGDLTDWACLLYTSPSPRD